MQNTSSVYKELIKQSGRTFKAKILCTLSDGSHIELTDSDIMQGSLKISSAVSNEGSFDVGCAIIGELDFEIDNSNGTYNNTSFEGAEFDVRIGLVISQKYDGTITTEWLRKGLYTTEEVTVNEKYISITAYDYMAKFDKDFAELNLAFPVSLANLLSSICTYCGVAYGSLVDFPYASYMVNDKSTINESTTCRDIISYIAQIACSYAYIDTSGYLRLGWYTDTDITIDEKQKLNGTVTVTGMQMINALDETVYQLGTMDYCLIMDDNPLVQNESVLKNSALTERLIGIDLTPFEADVMSDPSMEVGDIVTVSDIQGNTYKTPITSIVYKLDSKMTISCDAETIKEKQRSSCSQSAKVIAAAKKETEKQLSAYDVRAKRFSELTANSMGYYQTEEIQDDGSIICYQHDKPLLSDSQTIWKKSVDTIAVSNDGGKTWVGLDKDGNAVLKVLATEGIIADWIKAGTISDQTGNMSISLNLGKIAFNIDNKGRMVLHTLGFTLYDENDKVLTSMFCSTNKKGVVTANVMMVGERDSETTRISEDDNGNGYISTDTVQADTLSSKSGGAVTFNNIVKAETVNAGTVGTDYVFAENLIKSKTATFTTLASDEATIQKANIPEATLGDVKVSSIDSAVYKLSGNELGSIAIDVNGRTAYVLGRFI